MKNKLKLLFGFAAVILFVAIGWIYFFQEIEYTPNLYKEIVQATKDDMYATAGWYSKRMQKEDFHKLVRDLISNEELDLWTLDVGMGYASEYGYCDCIGLIEKQVKEVENRIGTEWVVKVNDRITKQYGFSDWSEWENYKETFITPRLKGLITNCSQN